MRWLVASALLAAGCDSLFNLDHLKAPLSDGGELDTPATPNDGALVDVPKGTIDAPPDGSDGTGECAISYSGQRYQLKTGLFGFAYAKTYCESLQVPGSTKYSHLAVVDDQADLTTISNIGASAWVGLQYDSTNGRWAWVTAQSVPAITWAANEPNGTGNCAIENAVGLDDATCPESHSFICECDSYPPSP